MDSGFYVLSCATPAGVSVAPVRTEQGQPVHRFRKELIRTGTYVKDADGITFAVDTGTLKHWQDTFAAMKANGVRVPVPKAHFKDDGTPYAAEDADANRGWLVDLFPEGDSLVGIVELIGSDAPRLAASNDVSILTPPRYVDGKGHRYERPIMHVALTPTPLIPGLAGWEAVAASGCTSKSISLLKRKETISMDAMTMPDAGSAPAPAAPKPSEAIKQSFEDAMMSVLKDDKLDAKAKLAKVRDILKAQEKALGLLDTADSKPEPKAKDDEDTTVAASNPAVDPMMLRLATDNYGHRLDKLVGEGKLTPAARKKLQARLFGENNELLTVALSARSTNQFDAVLDALADNAPVSLGERTGAQTVAMSNPLGQVDEAAKKFRDEMAANVKRLCGTR